MAKKVRALLSLVVVLTTMSLVGCGHYTCGTTFGASSCGASGSGIGGGNGSGLKAYFYFVDFSANGQPTAGIAAQVMNASTDTFQLVHFTPPPLPPSPTGLKIVSKKYMYIPGDDGTLFAYTIDLTTGIISAMPASPYIVAGGNSIASNAAGNLLFVGDNVGQQISVFTVNADGSLTAAAGSPFATSGAGTAVMATDGLGKFLYTSAGFGATQVGAFSIGSGGVLTAVPTSPFSINMSAIVGEPSGKYMLGVTGQELDNHIHVFGISSTTGDLAEVGGSPFTTTNSPINLEVHPSGKWVYSFNEDVVLNKIQDMEGFSLNNATGALTGLSGSPYPLTSNGGSIEPSGQFLFGVGFTLIANSAESTVTPYTIDSSGNLTSIIPSLGFPGIRDAAFDSTDAQ